MTRKLLVPLDAGGNKHTNLANGTASTDAAAYGQTPAGGNTATVAQGGTGQTSMTANGLIIAGSSSTAALAQVSATLNAGGDGPNYALTNVASAPPTWQFNRAAKVLTANATTTTTGAYAAITGLSVASLPAGTYIFRGLVWCDSSNVSGIAQISVSTPTTSQLTFSGTTFSGGGALSQTSSQSTVGSLGGSNSNTTTYPVQIWGSMITTGSGTFALAFATNNASYTTTARIGSWLELIPG